MECFRRDCTVVVIVYYPAGLRPIEAIMTASMLSTDGGVRHRWSFRGKHLDCVPLQAPEG